MVMGEAIAVISTVGLVGAIGLFLWCSWSSSRCEHDARIGTWMTDTSFAARWQVPFWCGWSAMRFPGVVCIVAGATLDGRGTPTAADDCIVVMTDDCAGTARDALAGRVDGEPFAPGSAYLSINRRVGDARPLATRLAVTYGAREVLVVSRRRVHAIPVPHDPAPTGEVNVHGAARPTTNVMTTRRGPDRSDAYDRLRLVEGGGTPQVHLAVRA